MVFFINIYNRAADPPDKDKGNQIGSGGGGDNDIVNNRYARDRRTTRDSFYKVVVNTVARGSTYERF